MKISVDNMYHILIFHAKLFYMQNPVFDRKHLMEYFIYGIIAAAVYMVPVILFLRRDKYEDFYYLFIGNGIFMAVIFSYAYKLIYRVYHRKRAASMLIAGSLATISGAIMAAIFVIIAFLFFFPNLFSEVSVAKELKDAPSTVMYHTPAEFLFLILTNNFLGNLGVGAFISVITSYAGKLDQTKDKQAAIDSKVTGTKDL